MEKTPEPQSSYNAYLNRYKNKLHILNIGYFYSDNSGAHPTSNLLTHSMVQSPSWEANWFAASEEIPRIFTEPEASLPHLQASANCPYPGPAQSSPHTHIPPPGDPS